MLTLSLEFTIKSVDSVQRNAVRTDAGEDRTVPHTVPLRGGALQTDACGYFFQHKIFPTVVGRRLAALFLTDIVLKPHITSIRNTSKAKDKILHFVDRASCYDSW